MNIPSQSNPIMQPAMQPSMQSMQPPSGNGQRMINAPNPNSTYPMSSDPATATAHMIGKDYPTAADFAGLMPQYSHGGSHGGSSYEHVSPYMQQQQPTLIETFKGNMYSDIVSQIKQPLLVAMIIFFVSLPIINVLIGHYLPSLLRMGGIPENSPLAPGLRRRARPSAKSSSRSRRYSAPKKCGYPTG